MARRVSATDKAERRRLGKRIESARLKAGFRYQTSFAKAVGYKVSTVNGWERGRYYPSPEALRSVAKITGEPVGFFTGSQMHARDSLEASARELGARLGYRSVRALLELSDETLRRGVAILIADAEAGVNDRRRDRRTSPE